MLYDENDIDTPGPSGPIFRSRRSRIMYAVVFTILVLAFLGIAWVTWNLFLLIGATVVGVLAILTYHFGKVDPAGLDWEDEE